LFAGGESGLSYSSFCTKRNAQDSLTVVRGEEEELAELRVVLVPTVVPAALLPLDEDAKLPPVVGKGVVAGLGSTVVPKAVVVAGTAERERR
jgi:hypothetical protein